MLEQLEFDVEMIKLLVEITENEKVPDNIRIKAGDLVTKILRYCLKNSGDNPNEGLKK